MVVRANAECSWCFAQGIEYVDAHPLHISIEGEGGLYDLCEECKEILLGPFMVMRQKKLVRANRRDALPDGWIGNAWPGAVNAVVLANVALAKNGSVVGDRKNNGGARPNSGPAPKGRAMLCPFSPQVCSHPGMQTVSGVKEHLRYHHDSARVAEFTDLVHECGLCDPPVPMSSTTALGMHASREHRDAVGDDIGQGGWALALVSAIRRAGDPHGTLKAMDAHALTLSSAKRPDSQLALEDSTSSATVDQQDQESRKDH